MAPVEILIVEFLAAFQLFFSKSGFLLFDMIVRAFLTSLCADAQPASLCYAIITTAPDYAALIKNALLGRITCTPEERSRLDQTAMASSIFPI